jgi:hypothetical protein
MPLRYRGRQGGSAKNGYPAGTHRGAGRSCEEEGVEAQKLRQKAGLGGKTPDGYRLCVPAETLGEFRYDINRFLAILREI